MTKREGATFSNAPKAKRKPAGMDKPDAESERTTITTAIHIRKETWNLLRAVAFRRAEISGGRASVSKLIEELVEQHRSELNKESHIR